MAPQLRALAALAEDLLWSLSTYRATYNGPSKAFIGAFLCRAQAPTGMHIAYTYVHSGKNTPTYKIQIHFLMQRVIQSMFLAARNWAVHSSNPGGAHL